MNPEDLNPRERVAAEIAFLIEHRRTTGADMARHFGISERTVYRDMWAVIDAGLPVLGISGDGYQWKPAPCVSP